jgi:hypothetical protein
MGRREPRNEGRVLHSPVDDVRSPPGAVCPDRREREHAGVYLSQLGNMFGLAVVMLGVRLQNWASFANSHFLDWFIHGGRKQCI